MQGQWTHASATVRNDVLRMSTVLSCTSIMHGSCSVHPVLEMLLLSSNLQPPTLSLSVSLLIPSHRPAPLTLVD